MGKRTPFWIVLASIYIGGLSFAADFPKPQGRVNDFAGILSAKAKEECTAILLTVEQQTGDEVAVVTIPSLGEDTLEDYAVRLFKNWGIGKKGKDNGVLLLVAVREHKIRIEVGYGLEPILPDGLAGDIIRHELTPAFKRNDFSGGIQSAVLRIADILKRGQPMSDDERRHLAAARRSGLEDVAWPARLGMLLFFACFVGIGSFLLGAGLGSKVGFYVLFGSFFGGLPCLMSLAFPVPHYILPFFGVALAMLGFRKARASPASFRDKASGKSSTGSGWIMGGSSSSGGGSSGSSGGFSGGSSGGGGASGGW